MVEQERADQRPDADVGVQHKNADDRREQVWGARATRHQRRTGDVIGDPEPFAENVKSRNEKLIDDELLWSATFGRERMLKYMHVVRGE